MSQNINPTSPSDEFDEGGNAATSATSQSGDIESVTPEVAAPSVSQQPADAGSVTAETAAAPEDESTIGTGTSMALGCIAGTVLLIIFGLLFLALRTLV